MNRVVHFEIHADNPERAKTFYETVFGWKITKWHGPMEYWLISTGLAPEVGIDGGLLKRSTGSPVGSGDMNAFVCTIDVKSFDEAAEKIVATGGINVIPKQEIPGVDGMDTLKTRREIYLG